MEAVSDYGHVLWTHLYVVVGGLPLEIGVVGSFASMLGNNNLRQCIVFVLNHVVWAA